MSRRTGPRTSRPLPRRQTSDSGWPSATSLFVATVLAVAFLALVGFAFDSHVAETVRVPDRHAGNRLNIAEAELSHVAPAQSSSTRASSSPQSQREGAYQNRAFALCGRRPWTCVVDGDTFWLDGVKIRIANIDTPEVTSPQCPAERALGMTATRRLIDLLNIGPFELHTTSGSEYDRYGRLLRVVVRDGKSLGEQLVNEGLAHTWIGHKEPWC